MSGSAVNTQNNIRILHLKKNFGFVFQMAISQMSRWSTWVNCSGQPDGMLRAYHGGGQRWDTMVWWTSVRPGEQPHDFEIQPRQSLRM